MIPTRQHDEAVLYRMELHDAGYNWNEIAKITGTNRGQVQREVKNVLKAERTSEADGKE